MSDKWTAIASRFGKVDFLDFSFNSKDEAVMHLKALSNDGQIYAIAIINPEKDKYWLNDISDRQDVETNLRESGLAPYAQFEGTFEV